MNDIKEHIPPETITIIKLNRPSELGKNGFIIFKLTTNNIIVIIPGLKNLLIRSFNFILYFFIATVIQKIDINEFDVSLEIAKDSTPYKFSIKKITSQ